MAELRRFGLGLGGVSLALAALAHWRGREPTAVVAGALGTLLLLGGALAPASLDRVYQEYKRGGQAISRITTPVFLAIVYFGVITPTAWVMRAVGRPALAPGVRGPTAWVDRPVNARRSNLRRQF